MPCSLDRELEAYIDSKHYHEIWGLVVVLPSVQSEMKMSGILKDRNHARASLVSLGPGNRRYTTPLKQASSPNASSRVPLPLGSREQGSIISTIQDCESEPTGRGNPAKEIRQGTRRGTQRRWARCCVPSPRRRSHHVFAPPGRRKRHSMRNFGYVSDSQVTRGKQYQSSMCSNTEVHDVQIFRQHWGFHG